MINSGQLAMTRRSKKKCFVVLLSTLGTVCIVLGRHELKSRGVPARNNGTARDVVESTETRNICRYGRSLNKTFIARRISLKHNDGKHCANISYTVVTNRFDTGSVNTLGIEGTTLSDIGGANLLDIGGANIDIGGECSKRVAWPVSRRKMSLFRTFENCSELIPANGYYSKPVTKEERTFPLAFGVIVYKDQFQVEQLLRTIYRSHNVYCIHVDAKSDPSFSDSLKRLAACFENVFFIQKFNVVYGSVQLVNADMACMNRLRRTKVAWRYYLNLSGQEFVLKSNLEIVHILKLLRGKNDIELSPFPSHLTWRYRTSHKIMRGAIRSLVFRKKLPFNHTIPFYKGSSYGMFSRPFVTFVLDSKIARDLLHWASDTYSPDEMIWATLNALPSAPGGYTASVTHDNKQFVSRAMIWEWDKTKCLGKYVRSVCVYSMCDFPWLLSRPEVFANKFHSVYDQLVLDLLEEWIHCKTMNMSPVSNLNWMFYKHVSEIRLSSDSRGVTYK